MTIVKLECTATKCSAGSDGSRWTTPDLPPDTALRLLDLHRQDCHGASASSAVSGGGEGGVKNRLVKLERPKLTENCSQQDF